MTDAIQEQVRFGVEEHLAGNLSAAESVYKEVISQDEGSASAHNNLGFLYAQQGRWEEALKHIERALEIAPHMAMAHSNLGQVVANMGNVADGVSHLEKAVELDPRSTQCWANLAGCRMSIGDFQGAEYAWIRANALEWNNPFLLTKLGIVLAAQKRFGEAIGKYQEALNADAGYADAWVQLGIVYFLMEDFGSAGRALWQAIGIDPENADAIRHLGLVHLARGEKGKATKALQRVVELRPDDHGTHFDLAMLLLSQGQPRQALMHFDRVAPESVDREKLLFYRALALREVDEKEGDKRLVEVVGLEGEYAPRAREILERRASNAGI